MQQVNSESEPIRTEFLQLKRDEAEGQQRAAHLQQCIVGQTVEELLGEQSHMLWRVQTRQRHVQPPGLAAQNHRMELQREKG